jgi:hypothetical protein
MVSVSFTIIEAIKAMRRCGLVNKAGSTPLDLAVKAGNVVLARLLVDHAADVTAQDNHGSTALDIEQGAQYMHARLRRIRHRFLKVCQSLVSSSGMTQT